MIVTQVLWLDVAHAQLFLIASNVLLRLRVFPAL